MGEYFIHFAIFLIGNTTPNMPDSTEFWYDDRNIGWTAEECRHVAENNMTEIILELYDGRTDIKMVVPACGVKQHKFVHPAKMKKFYEEHGI